MSCVQFCIYVLTNSQLLVTAKLVNRSAVGTSTTTDASCSSDDTDADVDADAGTLHVN